MKLFLLGPSQLLLHQRGFASWSGGISAVYVPEKNVYEGQLYLDTDNAMFRFWDDGRKSMPLLGWEVHDEGDISPSAATSSFSGFGESEWISAEDAAKILNMNVTELTPETFNKLYADTWIGAHEEEAAEKNPNPDAELAIVEEVKNENEAADEPTITTDSSATAQTLTTDELDGKFPASLAAPGENSEGIVLLPTLFVPTMKSSSSWC